MNPILSVLSIMLPVAGLVLFLVKSASLIMVKNNADWGDFPEYDDLASKMNVKLATERRWEMRRIDGIAHTNPLSRRILIDKKLFPRLSVEERLGVIAHELAHLKLKHSLWSGLLFILGTVVSLATMLIGTPVLPSLVWVFFMLLVVFFRREFEYQADAESAKFVNPRYLANVLSRVDCKSESRSISAKLTHPSSQSRAARLNALERSTLKSS